MPPIPAARLALAASLLIAPSLPALAQQATGDLGAELDAIRDELRGELAEARQQIRQTAREIQGGLGDGEPLDPAVRIEALAARVAALEEALARTRQELAASEDQRREREARREALVARNAHLEDERTRLAEQVSALQQRLAATKPTEQDAALDLEAARQRASESAGALVAAYHRNAPPDAIAPLADRLYHDQARLARGLDATLHRVRADETLGGIAARHFGNVGRWPAILEANRHVITDPDRLWPAMTLVLPMP